MATPTYVPLASLTLGTTEADVVFSSIPATYRDLIVVVSADQSASITNGGEMRLNGDTGSNYSRVRMIGTGSAAQSNTLSGTGMEVMVFQNVLTTHIIQIMDYSATDKHKTVLARGNNTDWAVSAIAGRWANTAAVNSITLYPIATTFTVGSTFSLYGVN